MSIVVTQMRKDVSLQDTIGRIRKVTKPTMWWIRCTED